ncbi:MAG: hypothetical protein H8E46_08905, partial [FCB group bacterium]|nr:hypothetical protein [FCB group bacterium]
MKVLRRSVLLAAAAVMLLAVGVWGQDSLNVSFAGYCYNFWDSVTDIEADSPYVYVGCMASGIHVVDASDPENPVEVSNFFLPCIEPEYIVAFNDYLFVNDDYDFGIAILDISVPENINLLTVIPASSGAMAIENEVLFLADYWNDVIVSYDISDIYSVAELDRWYMYTGSAKGIVIEDNVAYVSNRANRIYSLDISDPRSITVIDSLELDDAIPKDIQDGYLYLIDEPMFIYESSSFDIVDVSDPANLNLAYTTQLTYGNDVAVRGDFAYVTDNEDDGEVYNISDPAPTFLVANVGEMTGPVEIAGSVLYSWYYSGLQLFDISSTPVISPGANVSETAHLLRVYVEDDKAYLTDEEYGLRIVDISDPSSPEEIGCLEIDLTDKRRTGIAKKDEMLFVACDDIGLRGINVNFPWSPSYSYTFSSPDMSACDVFIKGDIMHVAWGNKYKIHDVSSLYYPPTLSILNVNTTTVCANDTLAVIGGDQKLRLGYTPKPSSPPVGGSIENKSEALKNRKFCDRII